MLENRDRRVRCVYFAALSAAYLLLFLYLLSTPMFEATHNDRFFSADDQYYTRFFFSTQLDPSLRLIKHPLLVVFGWLFTNLERLMLGELSLKAHYALIVCMQLLCSVLTAYLLERILRGQYGLRQGHALLLTTLYALSFSVLLFTYVAESYILSGLVLTACFYFARQGAAVPCVLLGAAAAGVTLTNAFAFALIVWFGFDGDWKRRLRLLIASGALFCAAVLLSPVGGRFYANVISGALSSAGNYSDRFGVFETLRRVFYVFFASPMYYIDTVSESPFGDFPGDALSFVPSAPLWVTAAALVWLGLLVWSAVRSWRDRRLWAPAAVLGFNLLLHGVIGYGLKEAFLYSLHHLSAQILIAALALGRDVPDRERKIAMCAVGVCLACAVLSDLAGGRALIRFVTGA